MSKQKPAGANKPGKHAKNGFSIANTIKGMGLLRQPIFFSAKWKYLTIFSGAILSFLYFYYSFFFDNNLLVKINGFESGIAAFFLNIFGNEVTVADNQLLSAKGSISVVRGCDGIEPLVMYILAVLIVPLSFRKKIPGLVVGILSLFVLNILRIAGLFLSKVYFPEAFDFLHIHGGYIIFISLTIVLWLLWLNWALKPEPALAVANQ